MSNWRDQLRATGEATLPVNHTKMVFEILRFNPEITAKAIFHAMENRGAKRVTTKRVRQFLSTNAKIESLRRDGQPVYRLRD